MRSIVKVRGVELGRGRPKLCVPITDSKIEDMRTSVKLVRDAPHDLLEWRADFYPGVGDPEVRARPLTLFREELPETPVLFTLRTSPEGGMLETGTEQYVELILAVIESGLADMVDVELSRGDEVLHRLVKAAHEAGVKLVASRHDFTGTPDKEAIIDSLCRMQALGADVVKYAVTPRCERDVLTLLDATLTMREEHNETPVITMSMGPLGAVSRVCGEVFGSCVTFGTAGKPSAPGQLPAGTLASFLKALSADRTDAPSPAGREAP